MSPQVRSPASHPAPAVIFFGTLAQFSLVVLNTLLACGVDVRAIVVPGVAADDEPALRPLSPPPVARSTLPVLTRFRDASIITLGWERHLPVWSLTREHDPQSLAGVARRRADAICVACWPRRLPKSLLEQARAGAINVHPSLLPRHRGPAPLFWTLRHGDAQAGVSVHLLDETLDGGPVLAQSVVPIPEGGAGEELEARCAEAGGSLVASCLPALLDGTARPLAQQPELATYEGWPRAEDFFVTPDHPARWAFTFIRAVPDFGGQAVIRAAGVEYAVRAALDYTPGSPASGETIRQQGDELWLACSPGTLHVLLA